MLRQTDPFRPPRRLPLYVGKDRLEIDRYPAGGVCRAGRQRGCRYSLCRRIYIVVREVHVADPVYDARSTGHAVITHDRLRHAVVVEGNVLTGLIGGRCRAACILNIGAKVKPFISAIARSSYKAVVGQSIAGIADLARHDVQSGLPPTSKRRSGWSPAHADLLPR